MLNFLLPALVSGGASLIGGMLDRKEAKEQAFQTAQTNLDYRREDRRWFEFDRKAERTYAQKQTQKDRAYAKSVLKDDRDYARKTLVEQRAYDRKLEAQQRKTSRADAKADTLDQRKWDTKVTNQNDKRLQARLNDDRAYLQRRLQNDRKYMEQQEAQDVARYKADRNDMQTRSNKLARATAESRGIDFEKLRDDAVKAGFNPLTAMSMAHAYSTQVDYQVQGGVYSPGAAYTVPGGGDYSATGPGYTAQQATGGGGGGGSGAGGGGSAGSVQPMGSNALMPSAVAAPASFQAGGGGYQSQFNPALSSGGFVKEAIDRAADSYFNTPPERDPLADALRNALDKDRVAEEMRSMGPPRETFGYDLTKQQPFKAAATASVPALRQDQSKTLQPAPSRMPTGEMEVGGRKFIPVLSSQGKPGKLDATVARRLGVEPFDTLSPGDDTEILGEIAEVESAVNHPAIRRTLRDQWQNGPSIGAKFRDYISSGSTGTDWLNSYPAQLGAW